MKEVELFSESVELGRGEGFGLGDLCRRRASVSRLTCATTKVILKTIHCFFLWMRVARLRRKDKFSYLFASRGAVSVRRRVVKVVSVMPQERMSKRKVEQGPQVVEEILAVVEVIPLERIFERTEEQIDDLTVQEVVDSRTGQGHSSGATAFSSTSWRRV